MMTDEKFEQAAQIFSEALALEVDAQAAFVDRRCGEDVALRTEVLSMLRASVDADGYFDELSRRIGIAPDTEGAADKGRLIGAYRLVEPIGSGGSGTVWKAERTDGAFEGQVAIKLIRSAGASAAGISRLGDEARHLAKLTHPNIARLLDAGVDEQGQPYLVLELVSGQRIDRYCNSQGLDLRRRIELFVWVLRAVAHAHSHLIVHRDLKPSNVLVDERGNVKLLDFGISKLLRPDADSPPTLEPGAALTPEYAAPEQLLGRSVTTATDVYALGLMLYELLAGRSPRQRAAQGSFAEFVQAATRDTPRASAMIMDSTELRTSAQVLRRTLRGDLDNILQKALAPEVERRYATAHEFAMDLERYLRGETVSAMPPTVGYRVRKFVGRHRGSVASALIMVVALLCALVFATLQMFEARRQRDFAQDQQKRVEASNEFYGRLLEEMGSAGQPLTVVELLDRGKAMLDQQYDPKQPFMGRIHFDLSRRYGSLRERSRELELLTSAEAAARANSDDALLAEVRCAQAMATLDTDREGAARIAAEAGETLRRLSAPGAETKLVCLEMQARLADANGDRAGALALLTSAREELVGGDDVPPRRKSIFLNDIARYHFRDGRFEESLALNDEALKLLEQAGQGRTLTYMTLLNNRAAILSAVGEYLAAVGLQEQALQRFADANWSDRRAQIPRLLNYAGNLIRLSRGQEAVEVLRNVRRDAEGFGDALFMGLADLWLASAYIELEQLDAAAAQINRAKASFAGNPGTWEHQIFHVEIMRATIARKAGRLQEARAAYARLLDGLEYPAKKNRAQNLTIALDGAARVALEASDFAAAETFATDNLELRRAMVRKPELSATVGVVLVQRAKARIGQGRIDEGLEDLNLAVMALGNGLGADHLETLEARALLDSHRIRP